MKLKFLCLACFLFACAPQILCAQEPPPPPQVKVKVPVVARPRPDLVIRQYLFTPSSDKGLRVHVVNVGGAGAGACVLRLTVRKIKGTPVGRTMEAPVPAIPKGGDVWVTLDASGILPNDVSLKDTTFKLNVDATTLVSESNEDNNEKWHNLN